MDNKDVTKLMSEVRKIINDCDFLGSVTAGVEDE
jgi:hypothetical protein